MANLDNNLNWNNYRNDFPDRYWKSGHFDELLNDFLINNNFKTCLDVGGGFYGTEVLKNHQLIVSFLDPNIDKKPDWMFEKIDWDNLNKKYDLIVCRGSMNYLDKRCFELLKNSLNKDGFIIANTFLNPPSNTFTEREIINGNKEIGVEKVRLNDNKVEHFLIYSNKIIEHFFYYYSKNDYDFIFPDNKIIKYGSNSYLLKWQNKGD